MSDNVDITFNSLCVFRNSIAADFFPILFQNHPQRNRSRKFHDFHENHD